MQVATAKVGAILVNVNPAYRTHELEYAVNQSGLRLMVSATAFKTSDYRGMLEEVAPECPGLERVVYLDTGDWAALLAAGEPLGAGAVADRQATLANTDPINIQYTSGTTGFARRARPLQPPGACRNNGPAVTAGTGSGCTAQRPVYVHPGAAVPHGRLRDGRARATWAASAAARRWSRPGARASTRRWSLELRAVAERAPHRAGAACRRC